MKFFDRIYYRVRYNFTRLPAGWSYQTDVRHPHPGILNTLYTYVDIIDAEGEVVGTGSWCSGTLGSPSSVRWAAGKARENVRLNGYNKERDFRPLRVTY